MSGAAWPERTPVTRDLEAEARGWQHNAHELASFTIERLVNRRDVWGAYVPPERREAGKQHTYTAPAKARRGMVQLSHSHVSRHFRAASSGDVIGLHSTSAADFSRWGGFDFDAHGAQPREYLDALQRAAVALVERLAEYGGAPMIEDSNGAGGWHVWVYFDQPAPTADVYAWLDALAERERLAHGVAIETYPKQSSARGAFGNWLRLPGRHHTKDHWSLVARPGEAWRSGADAARTVLAWPASPAAMIPPAQSWPIRSIGLVSCASTPAALPVDRAPVILAYLRKLSHGQAGSGRSDRLFSLARFLRHGMQCTESEALGILHAWNAGNAPPLAHEKVLATWRNADTYSVRPFTLRTGERHAA